MGKKTISKEEFAEQVLQGQDIPLDEWLKEATGEEVDVESGKTPYKLVDKVEIDDETRTDVLLMIIGKRLMENATERDWLAFKQLCGILNTDVDQAIEVRTFAETH